MNFDDPQRLAFDPEEIQKREEDSKTFFLPATGLSFIDDHFGPRPGCLHTLLGSTGRGKSTLIQSLVSEWGTKAKMLLLLTEESPERLEAKLALKGEDMTYLTPKLHVIHEHDILKSIDARQPRAFLNHLRDMIISSQAKILIIDNLTTSAFYEDLRASNTILSGLRKIAQELNVAMLFVAHTKKGVSEATKGLISPDDCRGSAQLAMTSDYFYTFYRIRKTVEFGQPVDSAFIYVSKSRDHDNQDNLYKLDYDPQRKKYYKDRLVSFTIFKSFMKERDRA